MDGSYKLEVNLRFCSRKRDWHRLEDFSHGFTSSALDPDS